MKKEPRFFVNFLLLSLTIPILLPSSLFALSELDDYKNKYEVTSGNIVAKHTVNMQELSSGYITALERFESKSKKTGDLDTVLLVRSEIKRFKAEKNVRTESITEANPNLTKIQKSWISQANAIEDDKVKKIVTLYNKYGKAIDSLQKKLVQNGDLEGAIKVKAERTRIDSDPSIDSALAYVKEAEAREKDEIKEKAEALEKAKAKKSLSIPANLKKGLVLHYSFSMKERSTIRDSSSNLKKGKLTGGTWVSKGAVKGSLEFDGKKTYIDAGNPDYLQITGDQTIAMWICPASMNARQNPYSKAYGGEGTMTLELNGTINYYYGTAGKNSKPYTSLNMADALEVNKWSHIVFVRDLKDMKLIWYKDGKKITERGAPYPSAMASNSNLYIGKGYTSPFHGMLDEIMLFDRALSKREVSQLYSQLERSRKLNSLK